MLPKFQGSPKFQGLMLRRDSGMVVLIRECALENGGLHLVTFTSNLETCNAQSGQQDR